MPTEVEDFIAGVTPARRRLDAEILLDLMRRATGTEPELQGSIVGFGSYHYHYASGRQGDAPAAGFAPRKPATVVYLNDGVETHAEDLERLGPHSHGVGCLYLKDLEQVDLEVLERIVSRSWKTLTAGTFTNRAREGGQP